MANDDLIGFVYLGDDVSIKVVAVSANPQYVDVIITEADGKWWESCRPAGLVRQRMYGVDL